MKKPLLLLLLLSFSYIGLSQISVSENPNRKTKEISEETLTRFKKTTTLFILPNVVDIATYESILKEHWTITPYKIVDFKNFDFKKYLSNSYSFAYLNTLVNTIDKPRAINVYIYATIDLFMLNNENMKMLFSERKKNALTTILKKSKIQLASISLYPKNDFLKTITNTRNQEKKLINLTYSKNTFYDFNAGFFKNGLQKIHSQLKEEKPYHLYTSDFLPEIKKLATHTLYIPEYVGLKFNGMRETNSGENIAYIEELFKSYDFKHKIIKSQELSNKIITNEIVYYAKYTRVNTQRFLHIINATTGEVIYRKHMAGLAYNLHPKHIFNLNNTIRKNLED